MFLSKVPKLQFHSSTRAAILPNVILDRFCCDSPVFQALDFERSTENQVDPSILSMVFCLSENSTIPTDFVIVHRLLTRYHFARKLPVNARKQRNNILRYQTVKTVSTLCHALGGTSLLHVYLAIFQKGLALRHPHRPIYRGRQPIERRKRRHTIQ